MPTMNTNQRCAVPISTLYDIAAYTMCARGSHIAEKNYLSPHKLRGSQAESVINQPRPTTIRANSQLTHLENRVEQLAEDEYQQEGRGDVLTA